MELPARFLEEFLKKKKILCAIALKTASNARLTWCRKHSMRAQSTATAKMTALPNIASTNIW
jgi:hypothetical protein